MPLDLPVMPDATVLRSATTTSVTPRWLSAHAAAVPSMPPPTMTTSAVSLITGPPGNPVGARQRHPSHRCRFDGHRDEVFGLEMQHVRLAAGARDGLGLHRQHPQVVGEPAAALDGVEPRRQLGVLRADPCRVGAILEVVVETGCATELFVFGGVGGDGCRPAQSGRRCRSRPRRHPARSPWRRRRPCGCRRTR